MITDIILQHANGEISLEDALIKAERLRNDLETELAALKSFKHEKSDEIQTLSKEYKEGYQGHIFEVRQGRITWNFKHIPEWQTHDQAKKDCESKYKAAFNAKQKGLTFADVDENGEQLPLPEINYSKPSVIIKPC